MTTSAVRTYCERSPRSHARAYTPATMKPATRYPARYMWISSCHMFELNSAVHGCGSTTLPPTTRKPVGSFIQPLTAITLNDPANPLTTTGTPVQKCARGESRSQP